MKKILAMLAVVAAFGFVSCNKADQPGKEDNPEEAPAPVADFDYAVDGMNVTFTNKSQNAVAYKWNFGDEETSKEENPKHEYAAAGEYTVTLTAANADGVTAKKEATVKIQGGVKAYFSFNTIEGRDGEFGKAIKFDATASAGATSIAWDFGDGVSSTEFTPTHVFPGFAKYTVKATVNGDAGSDTFTAEVETVPALEVIKGGSMNADDAAAWTVAPYWGYDNGQYAPVEGVYSYAPVFGCTEVDLGHGAVYKFESNPLGWDYNNKGCIYQAIDVREGDVYDFDCLFKWGEETQDNGHISIRVSYNQYVEEETILFWFNNWWGVHDVDPEVPGDERYTVWLPAFEGNIAKATEDLADYGAGVEVGEIVDGKLRYVATDTGKLFVAIYVDQVWGYAFGAGRDIYLDEVSMKAVVE